MLRPARVRPHAGRSGCVPREITKQHRCKVQLLSNTFRSLLVFLFDILAVVVAWVGGFFIRFNFDMPPSYYVGSMFQWLPVLALVHAVACRLAGLYRGMWVFASLPDLRRVLKAVGVSALALCVLRAISVNEATIPRSLLVLYPLLLILIMGGGRAAWRMWKEHRLYGRLAGQGKPVVIVGAGTSANMLLRDLQRSADWQVVALVDDDPKKWGRELYGYPVVGAISQLPEVLAQKKANHVILAMPSVRAEARRKVMDLSVRAGAQVFTVPSADELLSGRIAISSMRPVDIEDLLGREPVRIDSAPVEDMLADKVVLVTGAGGSIGSELCRQLARFKPRALVLVESSEFALYNIEQWLSQHFPDLRRVPLAGDVKDAQRMDEIFGQHRPDVVFHAAAYKHVPLMEVGNAWQAVRNNVLGTYCAAEAAARHGAQRFVLISTDKAVNPTNVMGATKRFAEMMCEALAKTYLNTSFEIVRFGNVLGSAGSVIPKFQEQIARGGPVTVTHPDINRFFMSIPEAAQLVLQAAAMGQGGEIFVLDMGQPVKIVDLARNMIRLSGHTEDQVPIHFTGLRPGEKLYEELLADSEQTRETCHPKLRIARSRAVPDTFLPEVRAWITRLSPVSDDDVRAGLRHWMPEYQPNPDGVCDGEAAPAAAPQDAKKTSVPAPRVSLLQ
ncbi:polysaccharide biosynthesis protein [Bordetella genomosp. 1]|uniref:Polysaccharide biosynthesis protein n=1 Tax=Bordetella genomosp. 1 TaxID=1395607 RepID=A0A261RT73_9BORD|nr:polysaccharide biosynthesis protein [Bordetella genomosp. 1]